jgi:hypothetical protein
MRSAAGVIESTGVGVVWQVDLLRHLPLAPRQVIGGCLCGQA